MIECPYCYIKVFPKSDGCCPSCGKSLLSKNNIDEGFTRLTIRETDRLPEICFNCGQDSKSKIRLYRKTEIGGESVFVKIIMFIISPLRFAMNSGFQGEKHSVLIKIPICNECKKELITIEPANTDFIDSSMTFIVHKNFKIEFNRINSIIPTE